MSVMTLTKNNFANEVLESEKTVLIDFWAPWCGPCRSVSPIIDELAGEAPRDVKVMKVNVDEQPELASQFRVMGIPTLVVMRDGKIAATSVGVKAKHEIVSLIEKGRLSGDSQKREAAAAGI